MTSLGSIQVDSKAEGSAEIGYFTSYTEKSITKYNDFYVAKKEYNSCSSMGIETGSSSIVDEEDFTSFDEALEFIK